MSDERDYVLKSEAWDGAQASYRNGHAAGRLAGLREAAEVANEAAALVTRAGQSHPEDSPSRDRCFARAREASQIAAAILALAGEGG